MLHGLRKSWTNKENHQISPVFHAGVARDLDSTDYPIYTWSSLRIRSAPGSSSYGLHSYRRREASITPETAETFRPLTTAWKNWHPEILAYFDHRVTNAYTESLDSLIRVMNRVGRGYSFEALRAKMLYTEGLHKVERPKFERRDAASFSAFMRVPPDALGFTKLTTPPKLAVATSAAPGSGLPADPGGDRIR